MGSANNKQARCFCSRFHVRPGDVMLSLVLSEAEKLLWRLPAEEISAKRNVTAVDGDVKT
jgi:hypothetical protein